MNQSDQLNELAKALGTAQGEFSAVPKGSDNPFFKSKYADLATVVKTAGPVLTKHGLSISQHLGLDEQGDTLTTWLLHVSGQYIASTMRLHLTKNDAQGQGSATTYARRYSYMAVLGLVADADDDGNAASTPKPSTRATAPYKPVNKPGLISPRSLDTLKDLLRSKELTGDKATEFVDFIIGKPAPESEAEVQELLTALEVL